MADLRKRYILFGYDGYYPTGPSGDEMFRADTLKELADWEASHYYHCEYLEVLDLDLGEWITARTYSNPS